MGDLITSVMAVPVPDLNWIGNIIQALNNIIGNYGWAVVVFAFLLKLLTLPLEFWQKLSSKRNSAKMKVIQPILENIDKAYAKNPREGQQEKNRVMKKYGYSPLSGCLPMLVTLPLMIIMFTGLTSYTGHAMAKEYNQLLDVYHENVIEYAVENFGMTHTDGETFEQFYTTNFGDGSFTDQTKYAQMIEYAQKQVGLSANETRESFLWVKNIWRPDTWAGVMPTYEEFTSGAIGVAAVTGVDKGEYEIIYEGVNKYASGYGGENGSWNGLLILPVLVFIASYISGRIASASMEMPGTSEQAKKTSKMTTLIGPLVMVFFMFSYTSALGIYFFAQSVFTITNSFLVKPFVDKKMKKNPVTFAKTNGPSYRR